MWLWDRKLVVVTLALVDAWAVRALRGERVRVKRGRGAEPNRPRGAREEQERRGRG